MWQQTYPRDYAPYVDLGKYLPLPWETGKGHWRKTARRCDWSQIPTNIYVNLGIDYANLNRLDEAEAVYKQAEERKLESELLLQYRY